MVLCPKCKKEMEKGILVNRTIGLGTMGGISQVYWCKKEGFFSIEDKVSLSSALAGTGGKKAPAYICKKCQNVLIEYDKPETRRSSHHRAHY